MKTSDVGLFGFLLMFIRHWKGGEKRMGEENGDEGKGRKGFCLG